MLKIRNKKNILIYFIAIIFLAFLSSWQALNFHFWKDDWSRLWMAYYRPDLLLNLLGLPDHPGMTMEQLFFGNFFGLSPFLWQLEGLILKIFVSLSISLMVLGITRSKIASYIGGALLASSMLGIESFTWASNHAAALILVFFGIGSYYWIKSLEHRNILGFILALLFISISFFISPARAFAIPLLVILWDFLTLIRIRSKELVLMVIIRTFIFLTLFISLFFISGYLTSGNFSSRGQEELGHILADHLRINNFLSSIGNLVIGWLIPRPETAHLSYPTPLSEVFGLILLFSFVIFLIFFLKRKTEWLQSQLFFLIFIILAYFPNWWFYSYVTSGASNRYLTLSAAALICFISNIIIKIKAKYTPTVVLLLMIINIFYTNKFLSGQLPYRSFEKIEGIWNQIDKEVKQKDEDLIFLYSGDNPYRLPILDWSQTIPFAIKRGIQDPKKFPILVYDEKVLKKLLCGEETYINNGFIGFIHSNVIHLSNIYAWVIKGDQLINISEVVRKDISSKITCNNNLLQ